MSLPPIARRLASISIRSLITATCLAAPALAQSPDSATSDLPVRITAGCPGGEVILSEATPGETTSALTPRCARADTLAQLIEDWEAAELADNPIKRGEKGDRAALRLLPDVSEAARDERLERLQAMKRRHTALQRSAGFATLSEDARMNYEVLGAVLDHRTRLAPFDESRMPFVNDSGFFGEMGFIARQTRFERSADYEAYAARLTQLPRNFAQHRANMRRGIEDGYTASAEILPGVIDIVRNLAEGPARDHVLYGPFNTFPSTMPAAEQARLRALGEAAITTSVLPAYGELLTFLETTYAPAARESVGIGATEQGRDYYRALTRNYTTLDVSPDEVHAMGLREVARIRSEMDAVIAETGFEGDFAAFVEFLRTDPQFYATSEQQLLERASWLAKRLDGRMPEFFGQLPRLPYGVLKVPDAIAPTYTTGRYWGGSPELGRAGNYMVNTYDLSQRPLYNLPALTAHEGVPGHHHQIALAQELENLPEFRKSLYVTAFGEGWGLYSEKLAAEMGLYDDPYERFGQLTYEMWRACRLVVDTGMHWLGWTREQAEACFLENSALSRSNIRTEVDRYISWPGQALAYKVGEMKILELRERAETALGEDFDIRDFHDAVLGHGSLPLSLLERQIDRYIALARVEAMGGR